MRNIPYRLRYLHTWFPISGAAWGGSSGIEFLEEEVCHWGRAFSGGSMPLGEGFETESLALPHVQGLCPLFTVEDVSSQIPAPAAVLATCCDASFSLPLSLPLSLLCVSVSEGLSSQPPALKPRPVTCHYASLRSGLLHLGNQKPQ